MTTTRRSFLASILAAGAAPAIVRAGSIMPIWVPKQEILLSAGGIDLTWLREHFAEMNKLIASDIAQWESFSIRESGIAHIPYEPLFLPDREIMTR